MNAGRTLLLLALGFVGAALLEMPAAELLGADPLSTESAPAEPLAVDVSQDSVPSAPEAPLAADEPLATGGLTAEAPSDRYARIEAEREADPEPRVRLLTDRLGESFRATGIAHLDTMRMYVGVRERGHNRGPEVEMFLRSCGLGPGYPWCAASTTHAIKAGGASVRDSRGRSVLSALATAHLRADTVIPVRDVQNGLYRPQPGDLLVWRRGGGPKGHIAMVNGEDAASRAYFMEPWDGRCGETIEGNTSSGRRGSQRDGDGQWLRTRCIEPLGSLRPVAFVPVTSPSSDS